MKLKSIMQDYFKELDQTEVQAQATTHNLNESFVPIVPRKQSEWTVKEDPNRLHRVYKFKSVSHQQNFVADLIDYEDEFKHNAQILIKGQTIEISVYTHYLNDVTEMDREYAKVADEIYKDAYVTDDE